MAKKSATTSGQERLTQVLDTFYARGIRVVSAGQVAQQLWPDAPRYNNSKGQVMHLASAVAARMLRANPRAVEVEFRRWTIRPPKPSKPRPQHRPKPGLRR